ncbi:MAG: glycosyltransferase [Deltaproteobacteria bacterium]|nr:MAG: glycosyltransferase [Deltaproteobacteria bacterium]
MSLISVVIPIYNERDSLAELISRLQAALREESVELLFVDDGSTDGSAKLLQSLQHTVPGLRLVQLSRNFGHQRAITAGLDLARGDAVVVMDGDLQDPPEVVPALIAKWRDGFDVVYGVRATRRGEGVAKRSLAWAYYRLLQAASPLDLPTDAGDFRLLSRRALIEVRKLREQARYLRGITSWIGFPQASVTFDRAPRRAGTSGYPWMQSTSLALDGLLSFSPWPPRILMLSGALALLLGLVWAGIAVGQQAGLFPAPSVPSPVIAPLILCSSGAQLLGLSLLATYARRILDEALDRPLYVIASDQCPAPTLQNRSMDPGETAAAPNLSAKVALPTRSGPPSGESGTMQEQPFPRPPP